MPLRVPAWIAAAFDHVPETSLMQHLSIANPKRPAEPAARGGCTRASWFTYYAGFSDAFVTDVLSNLDVGTDARIVDPWNGAGTTTQIANDRGIACSGFDINPAMVVVAKARLLRTSTAGQLQDLGRRIGRQAARASGHPSIEDPLTSWFSPSSAHVIRSLERAISSSLVGADPHAELATRVSSFSAVASFFYLALFRTVRAFLHSFRGSNPTWITSPATPRSRVRPSAANITAAFHDHVARMAKALKEEATSPGSATVQVANCLRLPIADSSTDAVVTSPPYCTRIDYAVATRPELAVLGLGTPAVTGLRLQTIGTVLTSGVKPLVDIRWGKTCLRLLSNIEKHPSHRSATYYYNTHLIYFDKLFRSLGEVSRILKRGGQAILVVQDSYYKQLHNDLQRAVTEMAAHCTMALMHRKDFHLAVTKAALNSRHLKYRRDVTATESVLWFKKE